ncbi:MAG: FAD-dependent oxidoreductase [Planctomycetes bacterium]|jgi:nitrite reductase (NADH) large subunit|nr:FAD-dependent oxidoreductase [Planctomycetota bacterium]
MPKNFVIVGSGPAGAAAAETLRGRDPSASIVLLSAERTPFYSRIRLPDFMSGKVARPALVLRGEDWFEERRIDLRLGTRAAALDLGSGRVALDGGGSLPFDALLLSTGARCNVPPFPGCRLPGVVAIRTVEDVEALQALAAGGGPAVAIGGGLLGLEMAAALASRGNPVTVVEMFPWLLNRQLDREAGTLVQALLERRGLAFRLGAKVDAIEGKDSASGVRLASGETLPAAAVVVSAGVAPETALAKEAGIAVNRGILVDDRTATSAPGVFAAGDCAEHKGCVPGIWPVADAQGKVAGDAMAGGAAVYAGLVPSHSLKVSGIDVFSAGQIDAEGKLPSEIERGEASYRRIVKDPSGRTVGAVLVGDLRGRGEILKEIQKPK